MINVNNWRDWEERMPSIAFKVLAISSFSGGMILYLKHSSDPSWYYHANGFQLAGFIGSGLLCYGAVLGITMFLSKDYLIKLYIIRLGYEKAPVIDTSWSRASNDAENMALSVNFSYEVFVKEEGTQCYEVYGQLAPFWRKPYGFYEIYYSTNDPTCAMPAYTKYSFWGVCQLICLSVAMIGLIVIPLFLVI